MRTQRIIAVALLAAIGFPARVTPNRADEWWMTTSAPVPSRSAISTTTQTAQLFAVTGNVVTAGGRVYLAVVDQLRAQLSMTRARAVTADVIGISR